MSLEDQVCNLELSKKLKELGVKQDSIWVWYKWELALLDKKGKRYQYTIMREFATGTKHKKVASAFTVAELGELLPLHLDINEKEYVLVIEKGINEWGGNYLRDDGYDGGTYLGEWLYSKTEANARAKMLIWLIENGYMEVEK